MYSALFLDSLGPYIRLSLADASFTIVNKYFAVLKGHEKFKNCNIDLKILNYIFESFEQDGINMFCRVEDTCLLAWNLYF